MLLCLVDRSAVIYIFNDSAQIVALWILFLISPKSHHLVFDGIRAAGPLLEAVEYGKASDPQSRGVIAGHRLVVIELPFLSWCGPAFPSIGFIRGDEGDVLLTLDGAAPPLACVLLQRTGISRNSSQEVWLGVVQLGVHPASFQSILVNCF